MNRIINSFLNKFEAEQVKKILSLSPSGWRLGVADIDTWQFATFVFFFFFESATCVFKHACIYTLED